MGDEGGEDGPSGEEAGDVRMDGPSTELDSNGHTGGTMQTPPLLREQMLNCSPMGHVEFVPAVDVGPVLELATVLGDAVREEHPAPGRRRKTQQKPQLVGLNYLWASLHTFGEECMIVYPT